ncbi:glycosyltransferase [Vibrio splendidus]|uniref:glycosyltransferase n=1 Tax=Vibrio splendidus TaxID=29497 RepID=UPI000D36E458|nr:glycosyltransferase [Vibrio splendidus]PTP66508.1 hypothetical protein CWO31_11880 [Vibrio splendidus]
MNDIKIAFITMQFPVPSETFASNDVKALENKGNEVQVYTLKSPHKNHDEMLADRDIPSKNIVTNGYGQTLMGFFEILKSPFLFIQVLFWILCNNYSKGMQLFKLIAFLPISFYFLRKLTIYRPQVVHLFWGHYPSLVGYLVKKRLPSIKLSIFLGAYDLESNMGVSRYILNRSDCIFTHSKANSPRIRKLLNTDKNINVVYRGTTTSYFLEKLRNVSKDNEQWLTVGRLLKSKGFDLVIDLFHDYSKINPLAKLLILGDGPYKYELESKVQALGLSERVVFGGHIRHEHVVISMGKSSVFLLLSSKSGERLPNVLKEAMLAKCICISSRTPGIEELIEHKCDGFIFDEIDYHLIPDVISNSDQQELDTLRSSAREKIIHSFDVDKSMEEYLNVWNSLILERIE